MQSQTFIVTHAQRDTPLVEFLAARMGISRKKSKALLDQRAVFVNQRRIWMAKHILRPGDRVEVTVAPEQARRAAAIRILLDDKMFLVADKPAGVPSNGSGSAEEILRQQTGISTLCAVHRLDQDTTGCLLLAKSAAAKDRLVHVFESGSVTKVYHAIVMGEVPLSLREINEPIDGKTAKTEIMRLSVGRIASHLKVRIATGRTHQIRKHMSAAGHPIVGDRVYLTKAQPDAAFRRIPRQMLHASSIAFPHPDGGAEVRASSPLPGDFKNALRALRLT